jgi:hypothetical protein
MRALIWSIGLAEIGAIEVLAGNLLPAIHKRGYEYRVVTRRNNLS